MALKLNDADARELLARVTSHRDHLASHTERGSPISLVATHRRMLEAAEMELVNYLLSKGHITATQILEKL